MNHEPNPRPTLQILQNTINEWSNLFTIGAFAYIMPAIVFIIFGSGDVQPWNDPPAKKLADIPNPPAAANAEKSQEV